MCWSSEKFDQTPPDIVCQQLIQYVTDSLYPAPCIDELIMKKPNEHFYFSKGAKYPEMLQKFLNTESYASGWISEISCFWAASTYMLFIFNQDFSILSFTKINMPVICVGFYNGYVITSQYNEISAYSFPELKPTNFRYHFKKIETVTFIKGNIVGCNDMTIRKLRIAKNTIELSSCFTLNDDDPICNIVETINYYVGLTFRSNIVFFDKNDLSEVNKVKLNSILSIWTPDNDVIFAFDKNAILTTIKCKKGKILCETSCQLIKDKEFKNAIWAHGFLTVINSAPSFDFLLMLRLKPTPIYTTNSLLGTISSVGVTPFEIVLMTSTGIFTVYEQLQNNQSEEIWRFANTILPYWNCPITSLLNENILMESLCHYDSYKSISKLAKYVVKIVDDLSVIQQGTEFDDYLLCEFFEDSRDEIFSKIRNKSFQTRILNHNEMSEEPTELDNLIYLSKHGDQNATNQALSLIMNSFQMIPEKFIMYCNFLFEHSFYEELIECVKKWSSSILADSIPLGNDLREKLYDCLIPFLEVATNNQNRSEQAVYALQKELNGKNKIFQLFTLRYFEKYCSPNTFIFYKYPEMINQMKEINSKYLIDIYNALGLYKDEYNYLYQLSISESDITIDERISLLNKALILNPNNKMIERYKKCAYVLKDFIERNYPEIKMNFFSYEFNEIIDTLEDYNENELALNIISIYENNDYEMAKKFLSTMNKDSLKAYLHNNGVSVHKEIIDILYEIYGIEIINCLLESNVQPSYIFDILLQFEKPKLVENSSLIAQVLSKLEYIDEEKKQKIVDNLCELVVELDIKNEHAISKIIRDKMNKCFVQQKFKDEWDD